MDKLSDQFVEAFRNRHVRDAILRFLRDTNPELYEEARKYASDDTRWNEFLEDVFRGSLNDFIDAQSQNLDSKMQVLVEMEEMMGREDTLEKDMRVFFRENPWVMGFEYQELEEQKRAGEDKVMDYRLKRLDSNFDIIEIKGPNDTLFICREKRIVFTRKMADALLQIVEYVDFYDKHYEYTASKEKHEVYKPRGILVIGKSRAEARDALNMLNSFLIRINIITYNDVLDKARNAVEVLSRKP